MSVYVALELGTLTVPLIFLWMAFKYPEGSFMRVAFLFTGLVFLLPVFYLNMGFLYVSPDMQSLNGTALDYRNGIESMISYTYYGYLGLITVLLVYVIASLVITPLINTIRRTR